MAQRQAHQRGQPPEVLESHETEGTWVSELSQQSWSTSLDCIWGSFCYSSLAYTLISTSLWATGEKKHLEWTAGSQCNAIVRKEDSWVRSRPRVRAAEETHSLKNTSTKPASLKNLTEHLDTILQVVSCKNNVSFVEISSFVEGHWWRHLLHRTEQISSRTRSTKHCFCGPPARNGDYPCYIKPDVTMDFATIFYIYQKMVSHIHCDVTINGKCLAIKIQKDPSSISLHSTPNFENPI